MTEAKHTPGPWVVADEHPDGVLDRSIKADGYYVATVHDTSFAGDCWDADAALIAAAPELLAAVKRLGWRLREHVPADDPALLDALDVIAKAESRP